MYQETLEGTQRQPGVEETSTDQTLFIESILEMKEIELISARLDDGRKVWVARYKDQLWWARKKEDALREARNSLRELNEAKT